MAYGVYFKTVMITLLSDCLDEVSDWMRSNRLQLNAIPPRYSGVRHPAGVTYCQLQYSTIQYNHKFALKN